VCDLGGSAYCLCGLERKICEKFLGDNSGILGDGANNYGVNM